jgi:oxygen-independent coproporphyrinogen-3 oxidase
MNPKADDLGIYVHVPFCKHECPYCDFYKMELRIQPARTRIEYPRLILRELELLAPELTSVDRPVRTIYFGGGTPSTLPPKEVGALLASIRELLPVDADAEVTLEANPENLTAPRCHAWRDIGINRLSIGAQGFAPSELDLLERLHQPELIERILANARGAGFDNISLDLIFALPGQTLEHWQANVEAALALEPEHISLYGLTYHEGTPFGERHARGELRELDESLQAEMFRWASSRMEEAGFGHYEVSNFARPGRRSRHNTRYWNRRSVVGLGPGAHSNFGSRHWFNAGDLEGWKKSILAGGLFRSEPEESAPEVRTAERLYTRLRTAEGISAEDDPGLFGLCIRWSAAQGSAAAPWLHMTESSFALSTEGWLVLDALVESITRELFRSA